MICIMKVEHAIRIYLLSRIQFLEQTHLHIADFDYKITRITGVIFPKSFRISIRARCTTLCDKVCHCLVTGRWFSPGHLVSSTYKTDRYDIAEILLKVAFNTIAQSNKHPCEMYSIQNYVIKLISDLQQVGGFLRVLQFPPPIQLTVTIQLKYC